MALVGNFSVLNKTAGRHLAGGSTAATNHAQCRSAWNIASDWRKFSTQDRAGGTGTILKLAALPAGYYPQGAWALPTKRGALSSHAQAAGYSTLSLALSDGRALSGTVNGTCTATATGALIVSGAGSTSGSCTVGGSVTAALNGAASVSGSCTVAGALTAIGHAAASAAGTCAVTAVRYAVGHLEGSITPYTELSPQSLAAAVLDEEGGIETGLTMRETLRLLAAAMAGEVSGAEGVTITFRSAVADDKDRIVATVDSNGNRTAITYDLSD